MRRSRRQHESYECGRKHRTKVCFEMAVVVSAGLSLIWQIVPGFWRSALLYFSAYSSHLLIDLCTGTSLGWTGSGYGMPLLWPCSREFSSPLILFFGVRHENLSQLFGIHNGWLALYDLL